MQFISNLIMSEVQEVSFRASERSFSSFLKLIEGRRAKHFLEDLTKALQAQSATLFILSFACFSHDSLGNKTYYKTHITI